MNFTKVKNPIDREVTLNHRGENYTIGPKEAKAFPTDVAEQWVTIFGFMTKEGVTTAEPVVEEAEEKVEEEVEKEEVEVKVPKRVAKKK